MKVVASSPSQAFLFGEHAVLYRKPALACSVNIRSKVEAEEISEKKVRIYSVNFKGFIEANERNGEVEIKGLKDLKVFINPLLKFLDETGYKKGLNLKITSEVPVGSGMASSASVSASIFKAVSAITGKELRNKELLERVYEVEERIHGKASKTGPACAVYGGLVKVFWSGDVMETKKLEEGVDMPLLIAWTKKKTSTKEMIRKVRERFERNTEIIGKVMEAIEETTLQGEKALKKRDWSKLGELMFISHGLLSSIGVSTKELDEIVQTASKVGALGAKLTGGGGGGCVLILTDPKNKEYVLERIKSLNYPVYETQPALTGSVIEERIP